MIPPKGLDELIQRCMEKGQSASKFACLSAIKLSAEKRIRNDYLRLKNEMLNEKDMFLDSLFDDQMLDDAFESVIKKVFGTFSLCHCDQSLSKESLLQIQEINKKIMGLISEKEDKMFRKFIEEKATSIAKVLMDVQTSVAKKHDCGLGSNIKNSEEFEFGLEKKLTQSLKNMS